MSIKNKLTATILLLGCMTVAPQTMLQYELPFDALVGLRDACERFATLFSDAISNLPKSPACSAGVHLDPQGIEELSAQVARCKEACEHFEHHAENRCPQLLRAYTILQMVPKNCDMEYKSARGLASMVRSLQGLIDTELAAQRADKLANMLYNGSLPDKDVETYLEEAQRLVSMLNKVVNDPYSQSVTQRLKKVLTLYKAYMPQSNTQYYSLSPGPGTLKSEASSVRSIGSSSAHSWPIGKVEVEDTSVAPTSGVPTEDSLPPMDIDLAQLMQEGNRFPFTPPARTKQQDVSPVSGTTEHGLSPGGPSSSSWSPISQTPVRLRITEVYHLGTPNVSPRAANPEGTQYFNLTPDSSPRNSNPTVSAANSPTTISAPTTPKSLLGSSTPPVSLEDV